MLQGIGLGVALPELLPPLVGPTNSIISCIYYLVFPFVRVSWETAPSELYLLVGKTQTFLAPFTSVIWLLPLFNLGPRESASVVMADDQQGPLPDRATFQQLCKKDLVELAVKYEFAPSPSLDKAGLQTFLKDSLDLEEYWQELKDKARCEQEA